MKTFSLDYEIGIKAMRFQPGKYYKHGGGCYPADAKNVVHHENPWCVRSVGGTYPFLMKSGAIFWEPRGFAETWSPTTNIKQAWEVLEATTPDNTLMGCERTVFSGESYRAFIGCEEAYAKTAPMAICLIVARRYGIKLPLRPTTVRVGKKVYKVHAWHGE